MAKGCGTCNLQGGNNADKQGVKILCLYDNQEHAERYTCKHWCKYISGISIEVRRQTASDIRSREDAERRHKENLKSAELSQNLLIKLSIISFILGIAATLITQWIISRW
jgi:hypothetical protein